MPILLSPSQRAWPAALAAAVLAAGCSSVDLGPRYEPPPVHMPQPVTPPASSSASDGWQQTATPQPVTPGQPIAQPLPPIGAQPPQQQPARTEEQSPLVTLTARLEGAAVAPPTRSSATGQLDLLYDAGTRLLRWKTSWSGLSGPITGVQFHGPAEAGQNGPPAMLWPGPFGATYEGRATLTPQQADDLLAGRWYVNVFTATYPAGEVRGQLRVVR
jgi:hypothetical protein